MKVGYIRVSTLEQNPARQFEIMERFGVEKIFSEKISGKNTERPQFQEMMKFVRTGDVLCIESFSRLSRNTADLLNTVKELTDKGVELVSHKESIDTTTPHGKLMLTVFAAISEFERECILERQAEGIAIAKKEGKYKGRKPIEVTDAFLVFARKWQQGELTLKDAVSNCGVSQATFFRKCKQYGITKVGA